MRTLRHKIAPGVAVMALAQFAGTASAQLVDFSVQDLKLCDISSTEFEFSYAFGVENRDTSPTAPMNVPFRISVIGPDSTVIDNQVANFEWPLDKHGTCGTTNQGACNAECPRWTLRVVKAGENDRLFNYQPSCGNVGDPQCKCVGKAIAPPKVKPKHNGPSGPYSVTITVDPNGTIPEFNEANNTMTVQLQAGVNVGLCADIPAASTWGLAALALLVVTSASLIARNRMG